MSYRMEYGSGNKGVVYSQLRKGKKRYLFLILIPAVLLSCLFREQIIDFILPGEPDITKRAIGTFVDELRDGEKMTDAFTTFCKVILDEEKIS